MNLFLYQLRQAYLSLKQKPGFVFSVVSTMGLTLGALLCVMTLAYLLLFKPLPYPEQDKLYKIEQQQIKQNGELDINWYTYPGLLHFYKNQTDFSESSLIYFDEYIATSLPAKPLINTGYVTPQWFSLLNTPMILGRWFEQTEALDTHHPVTILSYQTWQKLFQGDVKILNTKVDFNGVSFLIVGVTAKDFIEPEINIRGRKTQIWLPWDYNKFTGAKEIWGRIVPAGIVGKLNSAKSVSQVEQSITPGENQIWRDNVSAIPFLDGWTLQMKLLSFNSIILGDSKNVIYLLLSGIIALVLIACANLSNLFMSRIAEQQRTLAIHAAVGACKKHLFLTLIAESGILMLMSILLALLVAAGGFYILQQYLSSVLPRVDELTLNCFSLILALLCVVSFAYFFAKISNGMIKHKTLNTNLQSSGKGTGSQIPRKTRQILIISQIAIATALIFINANIFKQALDTINQDTGFKTNNLYRIELAYSGINKLNPASLVPIIEEIKSQIKNQPEVEKLSHSSSPLNPFGQWPINDQIRNERYTAFVKTINENHFDLIEQPLLEGRNLTAADVKDENQVWVVNEELANHLAPQGSALGINVTVGPNMVIKIIGVVKSIKQPNQLENPFRAYWPIRKPAMNLMIKFKPNQKITHERLINLVEKIDKSMVIRNFESLTEVQNSALFAQRVTTIVTSIVTILTFFLANIGLYGIISYSTQMRRVEIGTRLAIGAKRKNITTLVITDNIKPIIIGIIVSIILPLSLVIGYSEQLNEYLTLEVIPLFLLTVGFISIISYIACYLSLRPMMSQPVIHSLKLDSAVF